MRVGIVRSDIGHIYLSDVENRSQRVFSSQPPGQSRYLHKPTDAEFAALLLAYSYLTLLGSNTAATVNTTTNKVLKIKALTASAFTSITVTSGASTPKATIAQDLNLAFINNGLPFVASVTASLKIQIDAIAPNKGVGSQFITDTVANGGNLNTALGFTDGVNLAGLTVAALKAAVYPSATTINVASATIVALSTFASQTTAQQAVLVGAIADAVAPTIIETGPALLSFALGEMSKLISAAFQPGGTRAGLPAGIGAAIVASDGSTVFAL